MAANMELQKDRYRLLHRPATGYYLGKDPRGDWVPWRKYHALGTQARALRQALTPFATLDISGLDSRPDDWPVYQRNDTIITAGQVRAARALLGL